MIAFFLSFWKNYQEKILQKKKDLFLQLKLEIIVYISDDKEKLIYMLLHDPSREIKSGNHGILVSTWKEIKEANDIQSRVMWKIREPALDWLVERRKTTDLELKQFVEDSIYHLDRIPGELGRLV